MDSEISYRTMVPEMLVHIFQHLSVSDLVKCRLVCNAWMKAVVVPRLWRVLNIGDLKKIDTKLVDVLVHMDVLKHTICLDMDGGRYSDVSAIPALLNQLPHLETLVMTDCTLTRDLQEYELLQYSLPILSAVAEGCPRLKHLYLTEEKERDGVLIEPGAISRVVTGCQNLTTLFVGGVIQGRDVLAIAQQAHNLQRLAVFVHDHEHIRVWQSLADGCPQLQTLSIKYTWRAQAQKPLSLLLPLANLQHLVSLHLSFMIEPFDDVFERLLYGCRQLRVLSLESCHITDETIPAIVKCCPNLTTLELNYILNYTLQLTPDRLRALGDLQHLRSISLQHDHFVKLNDASIITLVSSCQRLEEINLSDCRHITDVAIDAIARHGVRMKSMILDYSPCPFQLSHSKPEIMISDSALESIVKYSSTIEMLVIRGCPRITEQGLVRFVENSTSLRRLEVSPYYRNAIKLIKPYKGVRVICKGQPAKTPEYITSFSCMERILPGMCS